MLFLGVQQVSAPWAMFCCPLRRSSYWDMFRGCQCSRTCFSSLQTKRASSRMSEVLGDTPISRLPLMHIFPEACVSCFCAQGGAGHTTEHRPVAAVVCPPQCSPLALCMTHTLPALSLCSNLASYAMLFTIWCGMEEASDLQN